MIPAKALPPPPDRAPVRRALLSVSDKTGLDAFARRLHARGVELLSTGGTARALRDAGLPVTDVADVIGFPEILGGRVKSLHPRIHGGILARRHDPEDTAELDTYGIDPIDLVVVNLYPFREAVAQAGADDALAAENIDIGGPAMLRAAAKNFAAVAAVVDPDDYAPLADALEAGEGTLPLALRRRLAGKAFAHTAAYDAAVADYFARGAETPLAEPRPDTAATPEIAPTQAGEADDAGVGDALRAALPAWLAAPPLVLRYGENPHQGAVFYGGPDAPRVLHGKALSYNNLLDVSAARALIAEFAAAPPTLAILKHTNPCGVGQAETLAEAYAKAFATDQQSPFGGIVVVNRPLDLEAARAIDRVFTEIIIAPAYEDGVLDFLRAKANRRLVEDPRGQSAGVDVRTVAGGLLAQSPDAPLPAADALRAAWTVPTRREPTPTEWTDLDFAWRVCKHVKSNAIVYARGGATLGIGAGQMSRIDASEIAVAKAAKAGLSLAGSVVASDAFFPFPDGLIAAADAGATATVQPGGSVRDAEVVAAADARGLAMVFTGRRHFRH